jgi:integrase/recombinase XerD
LYVERGLSPLTVKKYFRAIKRLKAWARRKRKSLPQLTTTDCRRWLICVAKAAPVTVSTINEMHCAANVFYRFLMTEGELASNPFEPIPYLPREKVLPRFLSPEDVERLMRAPDISTYTGLLDRVVMEVLYATGMRVAELVALRVDSINLEKRRILCTGKGSKQRFVIFGPNARKWLKRYLEARTGVPDARKSHYLFLKVDGKRLSGAYVWRHIREHASMVGLKDVSPHVLRHSFATHLRAGGASTRHIQELLGHEDMESTEVYTHLVAEHLRRAYDQHHPRSSLTPPPPRRQRG